MYECAARTPSAALERPEDAIDVAARARVIALERGERGYEAWTDWLLGAAEARRSPGNAEEAAAHYSQALALADTLGMRPLVAHCHLGLGKLYHRTDKREQAQEHLATATTMYREMGMTYWLEKAEAEMAELKR
jgi:tetratricopeptide (TPR) repeat protein